MGILEFSIGQLITIKDIQSWKPKDKESFTLSFEDDKGKIIEIPVLDILRVEGVKIFYQIGEEFKISQTSKKRFLKIAIKENDGVN